MASETEIANLAAVLIGTEGRLLSLDDDTFLARTLKAVWAAERQATIRDGSWNFAAARASLPAVVLPNGAPYPFESAFQLPADALRLIEVLGMSRREYQVEGRHVLCSQAGPLHIRYALDVPELANWDAAAASAFAHRLAVTCGPRIAGSGFSVRNAEAKYQQALSSAKSVDAKENPPIPQEDGSWIEARLSGGGGWAVPGGRRVGW